MRHPEDEAIQYACGELSGDPQPLLQHLAQCESCSDMVVFVQKFTSTLREQGRQEREQGKERPSLESLLKKAGFDRETAREIIEQHFTGMQKGKRRDFSKPKLPPKLHVAALKNIYEWYVKNLCADSIVDPRGNRVRFFPTTFIHLAEVKNKSGQEPVHRDAVLKKIKKGCFRSRGGGHVRTDWGQLLQNLGSALPRTKELSWAKLIASEPTQIFLDRRGLETGTETYVRNFGTDADPLYRVMICKVNGHNRDVITIFPRERIDSKKIQKQLWPSTVAG